MRVVRLREKLDHSGAVVGLLEQKEPKTCIFQVIRRIPETRYISYRRSVSHQ